MNLAISTIEVLALKKLAVIRGVVAASLPNGPGRDMQTLTSVLVDVCNRADVANGIERAKT